MYNDTYHEIPAFDISADRRVARANRQNRIRLVLVTAIARLFLLFADQLMARFLSYADPSLTSGHVRGQAFRDAVTRADPCGGFA